MSPDGCEDAEDVMVDDHVVSREDGWMEEILHQLIDGLSHCL